MFKNIGLPGYRIIDQQSKHDGALIVLEPAAAPERCPCCGGDRLHSKGKYLRKVRHLDCFGSKSHLVIRLRRYKCLACAKSFIPPLPGIKRWRQSSEPFREHIFKLHDKGICLSTLAADEQLAQATVARIYQQCTARKAAERIRLTCPEYLGIDEHTLHRNGRYVTTFCDLKNHKVFEVQPGSSSSELQGFLSSLQGRDKVKVICIDLSRTYRALIKKWFPNARILADRFHAVRICIHHFMELAKDIAPQIKHHRGYILALRKKPANLTPLQILRIQELFARIPPLKAIYDKIQELCLLLNFKAQTAKQCRKHARSLVRFIHELNASGFSELQTLAHTLQQWAEPIACMWRFAKNNSITEGFHRKMKLIQRRAYGFRCFNNYRLRVIAQCG